MTNVAKAKSKEDGRKFLVEAFSHEQAMLEAQIRAAHATITHDGVMGEVIESHWIVDFLARYLPNRYAVTSGIVIDSNVKTSDQMNVVIYDSQYTPTLLSQGSHRFVTAEAVYAVLEVKPKINKTLLDYAGAKAASVRALHRTSVDIRHAGGTFKAKQLHHIVSGIVALSAEWKDGLGQTFQSNLQTMLATDQQIDCGCALANGVFDLFDYDHVFSHDPSIDPKLLGTKINIKQASNSLVYFMFRLLGRLQSIGTVPAVDWAAYAEAFKEADGELPRIRSFN